MKRVLLGVVALALLNGFIAVEAEGIADYRELVRWVDAGADHAASLPPKKPK